MKPVHPLRLVSRGMLHFLDDHGFSHAAAVAYYSLLSLPPFLYLAGHAIRRLLPDSATSEAAVGSVSAFLPPAAVPVFRQILRNLPEGDGLVWIAVPALVWSATTAFTAFELAVNVAFGSVAKRRFWLSRLKAFAGVAAASFVLGGSILWKEGGGWLAARREALSLPPVLGPTLAWLSGAAVLLVTYAAFVGVYKVLPREKVSVKACAIAAIPAVLLWEGARLVFGGILERSPIFGLLTGALAGAVAFLLWIYVGVAFALFGAELAALLNGSRNAAESGPTGAPHVS